MNDHEPYRTGYWNGRPYPNAGWISLLILAGVVLVAVLLLAGCGERRSEFRAPQKVAFDEWQCDTALVGDKFKVGEKYQALKTVTCTKGVIEEVPDWYAGEGWYLSATTSIWKGGKSTEDPENFVVQTCHFAGLTYFPVDGDCPADAVLPMVWNDLMADPTSEEARDMATQAAAIDLRRGWGGAKKLSDPEVTQP